MNKNTMLQIVSAVLVLLFLILAANPFNFWMPSPMVMLLVCLITATYFIFAALVFMERPRDEREQLHSLIAGRISFLTGSTVLAIAIIIKELQGQPDPWIIGALGTMILTKIIVRIVLNMK